MGTGCLRAGRIVCGQDTTGTGGMACLRMERARGSSDGRPDSKRVRPSSLCSPGPVAQGQTRVTLIGRLGKHSASRQNTAGGTSGTGPCFPKVLMHTLAEDRIGIRPRGASGTRRSARPLARGRECKGRRRPRAANNRGDDACLKGRGCLTVESDEAVGWVERRRILRRSETHQSRARK